MRGVSRGRGVLLTAVTIVLALVLPAGAAGAHTNVVRNGGFELRLIGWSTSTTTPFPDTAAGWFATRSDTGPVSGLPLRPVPQGRFQAVADQTNPSSNVLYQDITVPTDNARLELALWYHNYAGVFFTPPTLSAAPNPPRPNQQLRIDLIDPSAPLRSLAPGDVLQTLFRTRPGDPSLMPTTRIGADIQGLGGVTVRLRISEVDNQANFTVGVDAVRVFDAATDMQPVPLTVGPASAPLPTGGTPYGR